MKVFNYLSLSLLVWWTCCASSEIINRDVEISDTEKFTIRYEFGFLKNGTMSIQVKMREDQNKSVQILLVNEYQVREISEKGTQDPCEKNRLDPTQEYSMVPTLMKTTLKGYSDSLTWFYVSTEDTKVYLLQLNCFEGNFHLHEAITALNPGGEHLSSEDIPFKQIYFVAAVVWLVLLVVWLSSWYGYRHFNVRLHSAITVLPFAKAVASALETYEWNQFSRTGLQSGVAIVNLITRNLARALFCGSLLLVISGWGLLYPRMNSTQRKLTGILFFAVFLTNVLYDHFKGFLAVPLVLSWIQVARFMFLHAKENYVKLHHQANLVKQINIEINNTPIGVKFRMFGQLRLIVVLYVCAYVVNQLWSTIILRSSDWVNRTVDLLTDIVVAILVGYVIRMRPFVPEAYRVQPEAGNEDVVHMNGIDRLWRPGMPVPDLSLSLFHKDRVDKSPVVLLRKASGAQIQSKGEEVCVCRPVKLNI